MMSPVRLRLKEIRESRGLTQVELAKRSGVGRPSISNIENHKTSAVDFAVLEKLADALDVNAALLIVHEPKGKGRRG
jgi:transcriptional regulator with XRE-family HTH domain